MSSGLPWLKIPRVLIYFPLANFHQALISGFHPLQDLVVRVFET